jgi:RNA polymerase sigma-70 factor (ECF subfamily)
MDEPVTLESTPANLPNEKELVARAIQRDSTAFGQLYEAYLDRIFRYVYYRVGSIAEAEDLTEQVFLKAWEAIDRYEARGAPFTAWLYRLAHNLVIDQYRGRRVTTPIEDVDESALDGEDVTGVVESALEAEEVRAAVGCLNPDYQQLIVLRFIEGMSHAEVARIIGKTEGATRVIQFRALQALAKVLESRGVASSDARRRRSR